MGVIQPLKKKEALQRMRELTEMDVPFSLGFVKYSETSNTGGDYKVVNNALLRKGYRADVSDKSDLLVAYIDFDNKDVNRQFYISLLMMFNGRKVIP